MARQTKQALLIAKRNRLEAVRHNASTEGHFRNRYFFAIFPLKMLRYVQLRQLITGTNMTTQARKAWCVKSMLKRNVLPSAFFNAL